MVDDLHCPCPFRQGFEFPSKVLKQRRLLCQVHCMSVGGDQEGQGDVEPVMVKENE
ncbi:MAG: hypothetical protein MZV63_61055 [Marinilabiliales bacterium]|nr:hypothetical protein [Marinilabiliales bacterium]